MTTKEYNNYRLGFFKKNKFTVCLHDFVLSKNELVGQYITSNWFKQEFMPNEKLYLFLIHYKNIQEIENIKIHTENFVHEEEVLNYAIISNNIISTYLLDGYSFDFDSYVVMKQKRIILENIQNNNLESNLTISAVKNKSETLFIYGPCFSKI